MQGLQRSVRLAWAGRPSTAVGHRHSPLWRGVFPASSALRQQRLISSGGEDNSSKGATTRSAPPAQLKAQEASSPAEREEEKKRWRREVEESKQRGDVIALARAMTALRSLGTLSVPTASEHLLLAFPADPKEMAGNGELVEEDHEEDDFWPDEEGDDGDDGEHDVGEKRSKGSDKIPPP